MKNNYINSRLSLTSLICLIIFTASCKKDKVINDPNVVTPLKLSLVEYGTTQGKRIFVPITKVGNQSVTYYGIFDTGSSGMTLDANGILPASMITSSGITVTGDSVVVNGITVTSKESVVSFGDKTGITREYGNLAYASITIGDQQGNTTLKRVPFFLYYKVVDMDGNKLAAHSNDVFGVGPGLSYANSAISSPLTAFNTGSNLTSGFKLATLSRVDFTTGGKFVSDLLTIGLTSSDLLSAGFIMHPLTYFSTGGYSPDIPATITYDNRSIAAQVLFDSGTPSVTTIEDKTASIGNLPANSVVKVVTNRGFTYQYTTTSTANLTAIQNPNNTNDSRTIFSIDFFIENEYLTDYANHQIGLKNN